MSHVYEAPLLPHRELEAVFDILLEAGADINLKDGSQRTPLMIAVKSEYRSAFFAQRLLENGANPNIVDNFRNSPLHYAAMAGRLDMMDLLLKYGATESPNARGLTPSLLAQSFEASMEIMDHHRHARRGREHASARSRTRGVLHYLRSFGTRVGRSIHRTIRGRSSSVQPEPRTHMHVGSRSGSRRLHAVAPVQHDEHVDDMDHASHDDLTNTNGNAQDGTQGSMRRVRVVARHIATPPSA